MSFFSRKKKLSEAPSTSESAQSHVTQQLHLPTGSRPPQEKQQSQPVGPWSAHAPPFGQSPSPFLRHAHAVSASATAGGELFLFGGYARGSESPNNDLYA